MTTSHFFNENNLDFDVFQLNHSFSDCSVTIGVQRHSGTAQKTRFFAVFDPNPSPDFISGVPEMVSGVADFISGIAEMGSANAFSISGIAKTVPANAFMNLAIAETILEVAEAVSADAEITLAVAETISADAGTAIFGNGLPQPKVSGANRRVAAVSRAEPIR